MRIGISIWIGDLHGCRIFLSLMEEAGLTDLLKQEGHFTLFAPSDEAFAGLSDHDIHILKSMYHSDVLSPASCLYSSGFQWLFCRTWDVSGVSGEKKNVFRIGVLQDQGTVFNVLIIHHTFPWSGDPNALKAILLYHFTKDIFIGAGLESRVTNLLKSLQGSHLKFLFVSV